MEAAIIGQFIAALACLFVAIGVLALGRNTIHIALAGLLTMRAIENGFEAWNAHQDVVWTWYVERGMEVLMFWSFALFATTFLSAFYLHWSPKKGWLVAGPILVVGITYAALTMIPGMLGEPSATLGRWYVKWGALPVAFHETIRLGSALLVAWVGWKSKRASLKRVAQFVSLGIIIFSAYWAGRSLVWSEACILARAFGDTCGFYQGAPSTTIYVLRYVLVLSVFIAWWVIGGQNGEPGRRLRAVVVGLGAVGILSGYAMYRDVPNIYELERWFVVIGVLVQPVMLGYAIARYEILGLRRTMRRTITQSGVVVALGGTFIVVSQVAGAWIEDTYNSSVIGAVATLGLLLALKPLQSGAEKVATKIIPTIPLEKGISAQEAIYAEQAEFAWADGTFTRTDRMRLDKLRERLGISAEKALRLEAKASAIDG